VTPGPWAGIILVLAAFRLVRLFGWDDFPIAVKLRARLTGERHLSDDYVAYDRPSVDHFLHCPFCLGAHISAATYGAWLLWPHASMYALLPFAISGAVGLVAKNLDA
jgi:hypothetical protein